MGLVEKIKNAMFRPDGNSEAPAPASFVTAPGTIYAPVTGTVVTLDEIHDEAISSGFFGEGVGIVPQVGIVYAPVSGTVVLVVDYMLFDETPDIEIHIQPTGRPDLDCVVLHTYDPLVAAGDTVVGGVTPISHVRDIASHLTDIQLYYYTPEDDPGNHAHVQVNNADAEGYRERKLPGALEL